jgi:hypothetical protein
MTGFHLHRASALDEARAEYTTSWRCHPSIRAAAGWLTTIPGIATAARPLYDTVWDRKDNR